MEVITDGDEGLRNFVQRWSGLEIAQQLDWFHIGMRIEHLRSAANLLMTYGDFLYGGRALVMRDPRGFSICRVGGFRGTLRAWTTM